MMEIVGLSELTWLAGYILRWFTHLRMISIRKIGKMCGQKHACVSQVNTPCFVDRMAIADTMLMSSELQHRYWPEIFSSYEQMCLLYEDNCVIL